MEFDSNLAESINQNIEDDDLLADLMNIVQNDDNSQTGRPNDVVTNEENEGYFEDDEDDEEGEILIDQLLEKPIDLDDNKNDQANFYVYDKLQIKNIYWRGCQDTILPEGWVQVTHACGMPLYLHRQSRVCTLSRPYFIGQASARKHEIPISAVPCLAYQKRKEIVDKQIKENRENKLKCPYNPTEPKSDDLLPNKKITVSITSNEEKEKETNLTPEQLNEYCKKLFEFDVIKVKKFKTWNDRKKFIKNSKNKKFPQNSQMLKIETKTQKGINKELNINMTNKTPLCILYEYANQVFKTNPRFEIQEKENPKDPFHAVCYINDKVCGKGDGNSKKAAKNASAEAALKVLVPDFKGQGDNSKKNNDEMYSFFDGYNVEHTHVYSLSQKLGAPLPYDVLLTCLKYNFAVNMSRNRKQFIEEDIKPIKYRNCLYKMKLAQYEVEVNCTKKKEGRQLAAQKILKLMHPHIQTWGSVLRLYGSKLEESLLLKDEKENTELKTEDVNNQKTKPNRELLDKLKEEMRKLKKKPIQVEKTENTDTLLTIPPLLLSDNEFKFSSANCMITPSQSEPVKDDDIIKFSDSTERKRKLSKSDESDTTESSSSSSSNSSSSSSGSSSSSSSASSDSSDSD